MKSRAARLRVAVALMPELVATPCLTKDRATANVQNCPTDRRDQCQIFARTE